MQAASSPDLAQVRLDNALALFEEFVRATARHADAATLRGLERRFAERLQIQPSYWSQIKSRSRQIGERLARQFEQQMHKPRGWMDVPHPAGSVDEGTAPAGGSAGTGTGAAFVPQDDDERFIIGLVLTYYRRHPQRARVRLLDLLGEVLTPGADRGVVPGSTPGPPTGPTSTLGKAALPAGDEGHALWVRSQAGVAPLKSRR